MTPDDLAALHAAAFTQSRPWSTEEFAALLASPHCFLVAQGQSFALGRAIAGEAELLTIATHPKARRQGLARACLSQFETAARARGANSAFLEVAADNPAAIALYRAAGFTDAGQRKGYYTRPDGPAVDALILTKPLEQHA
ncbi:ribosomal protein S18-alanine N-acetyltransferase [Shimia sp. FJ5]|uniref:ribosomal protein S18-alanine N-acetyltransferase n=1 Tax=Shimia sp. FJ5 TaxID=3079054 RepID=UPI002604D632|nr:ribosomal protein S18-alanine N-acetyltransferase [Shimia sp. FJ5]MDV4143266.1 ribosomal protein S18-alanine N-acetyltransferase [Shimia sp. FJ5]